MVYTGKPSAGCENCRKAKKSCDKGVPRCGRCVRLGERCGGYRDQTDLIFRNETPGVTCKAPSTVRSGPSRRSPSVHAHVKRRPSPDKEERAKQFFYDHFVTSQRFSFLLGVPLDDFLRKPVMACALAAIANRDRCEADRERSRRFYVDALNATNAAIRDSKRITEDRTIMAVCLLSCYERISWDIHTSDVSWKQHLEGAAQVLWLRGPGQVKSKNGPMLFREVRGSVVNNCNLSEQMVPGWLVEWTKLLDFDPILTPSDHLAILSERGATLRSAYRSGLTTDRELLSLADSLEQDLLKWAARHSVLGSVCAFEMIHDSKSPYAWNGIGHIYGSPQAIKHWNTYRCARILVSRIQEAIWRRSWPVLVSPIMPVPEPDHYPAIRRQAVEDICIAAAHEFGNDYDAEPQKGSIASGLTHLLPLTLAGTCLLELLSDPTMSPGGERLIHLDRPLHLDPFDPTSMQLAWLIQRVDYIAEKVGVRWAVTVSSFLKGETGAHYDICRSHIVRNEELDAAIFGEFLDLQSRTLPVG